jgi:hypothetical protein
MTSIIVTAYYKIPSKQSHSFYMEHIKRFIRSVTASVIFFTTPDVQEEITGFGYDISHIQFVMLQFEDLAAWSKLGREFWDRQKERDQELYHTPELGVIWYEKKEFIKRAINLCNADIFIWCDAGCIRDTNAEETAIDFGCRNYKFIPGKLYVQKIRNIPKKDYYIFPDKSIAGAIIAGDRIAWNYHSELYDSVLQEYDAIGISAMSDQYVTLTCIGMRPELYVPVLPEQNNVNEWFFFLQHL